jgi:hypothetical protein
MCLKTRSISAERDIAAFLAVRCDVLLQQDNELNIPQVWGQCEGCAYTIAKRLLSEDGSLCAECVRLDQEAEGEPQMQTPRSMSIFH